MCGRGYKEWAALPHIGAWGGIILIWDMQFATKVELIEGQFTLIVLLDVKGEGKCWFTNIYGPTRYRSRLDFGSCCVHYQGFVDSCGP